MDTLRLTINGTSREDRVEPRLLLVQYLRDVVRLTGTHVGCDTSQCGACTVLMDGLAVKSCTLFAVQVDGSTIETIEGLSRNGSLSPVQHSFWEEHGLQCGFCTPGMVVMTEALLRENPDPTEAEIRHALEGNLCRCTGYHNIVRAIRAAASKRAATGGGAAGGA